MPKVTSGMWAYGRYTRSESCVWESCVWVSNAGEPKSSWSCGFSTWKGKVQSILTRIDSFEQSAVRDLVEIKCVFEVIKTYDVDQEDISPVHRDRREWTFPKSRFKFQKGEEVSQKVNEVFLNYHDTYVDFVSRELYTGLDTPDLVANSRSLTIDSNHQVDSLVFGLWVFEMVISKGPSMSLTIRLVIDSKVPTESKMKQESNTISSSNRYDV